MLSCLDVLVMASSLKEVSERKEMGKRGGERKAESMLFTLPGDKLAEGFISLGFHLFDGVFQTEYVEKRTPTAGAWSSCNELSLPHVQLTAVTDEVVPLSP